MPREMTMTTELKQPAPTAQSVRSYGKTLALKIDALRAGAGQLALQSARGETGAQSSLAALDVRIRALEYELSLNPDAVELARQDDAAAAEAWRSAIQAQPAEEIVAGMTRDSCGSFCVPGSFCAISGSVSHAAGTCSHPVLSRHLQFLDETGRRIYRYADDPRAAKNYAAACRKLKVSS
jgi:hypothetical protein